MGKCNEEFGCEIDFVFLDLNPSRGALNKILIMTSNYLIASTIADFHSAEMISYLKENFIEWINDITKFKYYFSFPHKTPKYDLPKHNCKFLGYIINRVDATGFLIGEIENGVEQSSFRRNELCWIRKVREAANNFVETLQNYCFSAEFLDLSASQTGQLKLQKQNYQVKMSIHKDVYSKINRTCELGIVREFWGLKNIAHIVHLPVHFLQERHLVHCDKNDFISPMESKEVLEKMKAIEKFKQIFQEIFNTIIQLTQL